ncbi:MAG: hypothetical protein AABY32_01255 [Nanoarchaeota archaeon]
MWRIIESYIIKGSYLIFIGDNGKVFQIAYENEKIVEYAQYSDWEKITKNWQKKIWFDWREKSTTPA